MATQPEVSEWDSCVGVSKFGLFVCSLRLGVGSESDDDDSEDVSVGASGDGCVRNCGMGGSDAGLRLGFLAVRRDDRIPERDAVMCPRAVAGE